MVLSWLAASLGHYVHHSLRSMLQAELRALGTLNATCAKESKNQQQTKQIGAYPLNKRQSHHLLPYPAVAGELREPRHNLLGYGNSQSRSQALIRTTQYPCTRVPQPQI